MARGKGCKKFEKRGFRREAASENRRRVRHANHEDHEEGQLGGYVAVMKNLYDVGSKFVNAHFKNFFRNLYRQVADDPKLGLLDGAVAVNKQPHLKGNCYFTFETQDDAETAVTQLDGTLLHGAEDKKIAAEMSQIRNLREAMCPNYISRKFNSCKKDDGLHLERLEEKEHRNTFGPRNQGRRA